MKANKSEENIAKMVEKEKSKFAGCELMGKEAWRNWSWCDWRKDCQCCSKPWHGGIWLRSLYFCGGSMELVKRSAAQQE